MSDPFQLTSETPAQSHTHYVTMTPNRHVILAALREKPELTLTEAVQLIGGKIYTNERFHVGNTLTRMIKAGLIRRVKPGVYALPEGGVK